MFDSCFYFSTENIIVKFSGPKNSFEIVTKRIPNVVDLDNTMQGGS